MKKNVKAIDNNQGQNLKMAGGDYRVIISGKDTNGAYAMIEMSVPIGAGPIPHSHADFEEIFYVVEGEVFFKSETGSFLAQKGATVAIPKGGIVHNFKNNGDTPAKLLCTVIPAGLDDFFVEAAALMDTNQQNKELDLKAQIQLLAEKYGQKFYSPNFLD